MSAQEHKPTTTDITNNTPNLHMLYLLPEDIMEPEETNVRPFSTRVGDTEEELTEIAALGASIAQEGQIQPIKVKPIPGTKDGEPQWALIAGRRRRRAVMMHNLALAADQTPVRLTAVLGDEETKPSKMYRQALHENIQRKGLGAIDFAEDIAFVRKKFKWAGANNTPKVAEYFGVSRATINQHEKLNALPDEMKLKVHKGELSRQDAYDLAAIAEKDGPDAALKALAAAEAAASAGDVSGVEHETDAPAAGAAGGAGTGTGAGNGKKKSTNTAKKAKGKKSAAIKAAKREAGVATPRNKKELVEFFEGCLGPVYGYPDGAVHQFCVNFVKYAAGEITDRTLTKYFDAMVDQAPKGTAASVKKEEPAKETGAAKGGKRKKK